MRCWTAAARRSRSCKNQHVLYETSARGDHALLLACERALGDQDRVLGSLLGDALHRESGPQTMIVTGPFEV